MNPFIRFREILGIDVDLAFGPKFIDSLSHLRYQTKMSPMRSN